MPTIKILPPDVSNKIAAGEVVERPASVVKELVENAVDAEGTNIQVDIRAGGKRLIRVSDNGIGMSREDALIALERHATSKVGSVEDLQRIQTFGFRGEALPSIASVSQFELLTRTSDGLEGTNVTVEGGVVRSVQESGCSPGTHISVNNLFYNVPARLKFLKSENTELNHITNQVHWAALAQPKVQFSLTHNGRSLVDVRVCDAHIERIRLLYGKDFADWFAADNRGTDFLFRLADETGVVLLPGNGFEVVDASVRISLANLTEAAYADIGKFTRRVLDELHEEFEKDKS